MEFDILLMSHGEFAKEMLNSCEMIIGKVDHIKVLSLLPGMSTETLLKKAREILQQNKGETLVLTDLYGGSPSNTAFMLTKVCNAKSICGLNLPMLIETIMRREYGEDKTLTDIIPHLVTTGKEACKQVFYEEAMQ